MLGDAFLKYGLFAMVTVLALIACVYASNQTLVRGVPELMEEK
jgi:hypothetical protein